MPSKQAESCRAVSITSRSSMVFAGRVNSSGRSVGPALPAGLASLLTVWSTWVSVSCISACCPDSFSNSVNMRISRSEINNVTCKTKVLCDSYLISVRMLLLSFAQISITWFIGDNIFLFFDQSNSNLTWSYRLKGCIMGWIFFQTW